jgi:hypothetical protein
MSSIEDGGAMTALRQMRFENRPHFRRNVIVDVIRNFTPNILAIQDHGFFLLKNGLRLNQPRDVVHRRNQIAQHNGLPINFG